MCTHIFSGHVRKCNPGLTFAAEVHVGFAKSAKFYTRGTLYSYGTRKPKPLTGSPQEDLKQFLHMHWLINVKSLSVANVQEAYEFSSL